MRLSALLALSLCVAACGPRQEDTAPEGKPDLPDGPGCVSDGECSDGEICEDDVCIDGDRDNDLASATALLWDNPTDGAINPEGDVDWYAVQADGGEFVRISVVTAEEDGGLDSVVSIYTAGGKRLAWEDEHPAGNVSSADSMCFAYFPDAGTYYIKVEDRGTFYDEGLIGGPDEAYRLTVEEWDAVVRETDSPQDAGLEYGATAINTLYSIPVLLEEPGDTDWAAVTLPAAGSPVSLVAMANDEESEVRARITMRNRDGDDVLSILDPTASAYGMLPNPEGTDYVIGVTDENGGGGPDYWTWVFFIVRAAGSGNPPGTEPDDTIETAEVLSLEDQEPDSGRWYSGYRQGRVSTAEDVDTYAFTAAFDGAYVTVYVGAQRYGSLLVPRLELLDEAGESLGVVDSTPGVDTNAVNLGPFDAGTYHLRVSGTPESVADGGEGYFYLFGLHLTDFRID